MVVALVTLAELLEAATPPEHGEETYELKQRWDEFNLASQKLSYLAPDLARLALDMGEELAAWKAWSIQSFGADEEVSPTTNALLARLGVIANKDGNT